MSGVVDKRLPGPITESILMSFLSNGIALDRVCATPNQKAEEEKQHGNENKRGTCPWGMGRWIVVEKSDSAPAG
jgi:hypothetical protein